MGRNKLSQAEVAKRMVRLRNLEKLHRIGKHRRDLQHEIIAKLEALVANQQALLEQQDVMLNTQAIRIAELETLVFGKKKKPKKPPDDGTPPSGSSVRTPQSYHRPVPPVSAITATERCPVSACHACGGKLQNITAHIRYVEDIPLPELTEGYTPRLATKYFIERGTCAKCGKHTSGRHLGGAEVSLGPNVRLLVAHLVSVGGMSYQQIVNLLLTLYGLVISKAEIASILQTKHKAWLPAYNQLKQDIRAAPVVHVDETPWAIQKLQGAGYAWALADANSPKVCFALENSRAVVHAKKLFGMKTDAPFVGVRISDDYGAYRSVPGIQQLCWAHLYRTIRDVRHNENLPKEQLPYVIQWYAGFASIYQDLRTYLGEPYDEVVRATQATALWQRVQALAKQPAPKNGEPNKLTRLKAQLQRAGKDRLLTCLTKDTPCDNNRAERDLRQLVLKRKRSFGSQTQQGAKALATILSLCTTAWRTTQPQKYFSTLASLAG